MTYTVRMQYLDSQPLSFPWHLAVSLVPEQSVFANFYTLKFQFLYFFKIFLKLSLLTQKHSVLLAPLHTLTHPYHHHNRSGFLSLS